VEVMGGIFAGGDIAWSDFGRFQLCTTLGNALGGTFFVAVLKHGHAAPGKLKKRGKLKL
jgi:formate/nitrite transporter FocA (FNT family)